MGTEPKQDTYNYFKLKESVLRIFTCSGTEVTNHTCPNDDVASASWKYSEDNVAAGKNIKVAVAAYVTTEARLKLYDYLSE